MQLCGIALIAVGVVFLINYGPIKDAFTEQSVNVAPYLFIVLGVTIFIISFFGCCGAVQESHCMISTVSLCSLPNIFIYIRFK